MSIPATAGRAGGDGTLPVGWRSVRLGDVAALINGDRGKNYPSQQYRVAAGVPFINAGHLEGGGVQRAAMDYITAEHFERLRAGRVRSGDVLLCIRGSIGRAALVDEAVVPGAIASSLVILRPQPDLDSRFLLAFLTGPTGQATIANYENGSAQPNLGARDVAAFTVPLPPLATQRKIAAVLSAYDDLIENNNRRIKILEEMAQRIYREWFVEFRYPGHENVPLGDSEVGPIPMGWEVQPLEAVCDLMQAGGTPSRADPAYWDGGTFDWFKTTELQDGFLYRSAERVTQAALAARKTRSFPAGTILMAIYGSPTVGRMGVLTADGCCNQAALALHADEERIPQSLLYYILDGLRGHFNSIAQGAAQQNISKQKVARTKVTCPAVEVTERWTGVIGPNWRQRSTLAATLRTLGASRDLLLPRLVSGDIDVTGLDIDAPELAA